MLFRAIVPDGVLGGQVVAVHAAGVQFNVRVPPNVKGGDTFHFTVTEEQYARAQKLQAPEGSNPPSSYLDDINRRGVPLIDANIPGILQRTPLILWHGWNDLATALGLGVTIGVSIVLGFIVGVLYVTDPSQPV